MSSSLCLTQTTAVPLSFSMSFDEETGMAQQGATETLHGENPAHDARQLIRNFGHKGHTAGMAPGYVQANLAYMP